MQWTGEERRSIPQVTRAEFSQFVAESNQQRQEIRDMVREIKSTMIEIQRDIKCVHQTWDAHVEEYGDLLKETKEAREHGQKLKSAITEKSLTGMVWAMIVLIGFSVWDYIKSNVK
jgi:uncharacterized coiled-coil DUF342 family protein